MSAFLARSSPLRASVSKGCGRAPLSLPRFNHPSISSFISPRSGLYQRRIQTRFYSADKQPHGENNRPDNVPKGFENFFGKVLRDAAKKAENGEQQQASKSGNSGNSGSSGQKSSSNNNTPHQNHNSERSSQNRGNSRNSSNNQGGSQRPPNRKPFPPSEGQFYQMKISPNTVLPIAFTSYVLYKAMSPSDNTREITWQEFRSTFLDRGLVDRLVVLNRNRVKVFLRSDAPGQIPGTLGQPHGTTYTFSIGSVEAFERKLDEAQSELGIPGSERIPVSYRDEVNVLGTLIHFAPTLLLVGVLVYMAKKGGGGAGQGIFGVGKSKAKLFNQETDISVKFKDVAGMDEAKVEIME
ncbi:AAA ATPase afg3, partial [Linnemannia schmuckeri]